LDSKVARKSHLPADLAVPAPSTNAGSTGYKVHAGPARLLVRLSRHLGFQGRSKVALAGRQNAAPFLERPEAGIVRLMRFSIWVVVVVIAGCTETDPTYCDEEVECEPGYWCNLDTKTCIRSDAGPDGMPDHGGLDGTPDQERPDGVLDVGLADRGPPDIKPGPDGPHCGDGKKNLAEECDKTDLAGESCATLGYAVGTLKCTAGCKFDKSGCRYWELIVPAPTTEDLNGVWGSSPTNIWVVGANGTVLLHNGATWVKAQTPMSTAMQVGAIWGTSPADVWAGASHIYHFDGKGWSQSYNADAHSFSGTSSSDFWAVASSEAHHYNGAQWKTETLGGILRDVFSLSKNQVFAVGNGGTKALLHVWNGTTWSSTAISPLSTVMLPLGVWATAADSVWVVNHVGEVLRYDGKVWKIEFTSSSNLTSISGTGPKDIWAVGYNGTILHYDGVKWVQVVSPTKKHLQEVWGSTVAGCWIVGDAGTVLRLK
jgi:hypothetical protein